MNNRELVTAIRKMFAADEKPEGTTSLDLLQTIRLLVQNADETDIWPSQETLATDLCSSADAIARSQKRLHAHGWIVVRKGGYRGRTNLYTVQLERLPVGDLSRTVVSEDARTLAWQFGQVLKVTLKKKLMRNWLQQWAFQMQKLIKKTGGDVELTRAIVNFAVRHPLYCQKAKRGPGELKKHWRTLTVEYHKYAAAQAQRQRETVPGIVPTPSTPDSALENRTGMASHASQHA